MRLAVMIAAWLAQAVGVAIGVAALGNAFGLPYVVQFLTCVVWGGVSWGLIVLPAQLGNDR